MTENVRRTWRRWYVAQKLRSGRPLQGPQWVSVGLMDGCNYRCVWCATHSRLLPPQGYTAALPRRVFRELVEDLQRLGTRLVEFSGVGEPLLHPDALPMVRAVRESGIDVLLITNGSLLTRDACDELVDIGVGTVNVSLNAATDKSHAHFHGARRGDRARIVEMVSYLRRARDRRGDGKPYLSVSTIMHRDSYGEVVALAEQAVQMDVDHLFFAPLGMNAAGAQLALTRAQDEEARRLVQAAEGVMRAAGKQTNARDFLDRPVDPYYTRELVGHIPCHIGQLFSRVLGTGDVYPCSASRHMPLGNLATTRFWDIWHSEGYRAFRRQAMALPRRKEPVEGCGCWCCGQHFLIKQYNDRLQRGEVAA